MDDTGTCKVVCNTAHTNFHVHAYTHYNTLTLEHAVNIILYDNFVSLPGWFVDNAILF
jgi:hypothetical protein